MKVGGKIVARKNPKYYVRPDGLHEASRIVNGKRVVFRGRTDAEVEQKMMAYTEKEERGPLFSEVAERWKAEHFTTLSPSTAKGYKASYNRAKDRFKDLAIKELMPADIDAMLQNMARQQYARKTVATQLLLLNLICRSAVLEGIIRINPCSAVRVPRGLKHTPRELPSDEDLKAVKEGWQLPGGLLPYLILYTGCRRGEALALTYKDIDRKRKIITINKSVCYSDLAPFIKKPKTSAGIREIILLDKLAAVLPLGIGDALLFPGPDGNIMRESTLKNRWKKWQDLTGVTLTPHQLRHGYATMLFEAGISERDAMDLLGHADINMTKNIYTHIRKTRKEETAAKLNEIADRF
jgi:integrase